MRTHRLHLRIYYINVVRLTGRHPVYLLPCRNQGRPSKETLVVF